MQRWRLVNPMRIARLMHTPEKFSSFLVNFLVEYVQ